MFICDVCSKPYSLTEDNYLTFKVIDYKFMHVCSSCCSIRNKLTLKSPYKVQVWAKTEEAIKFYPSFDALVDDGDTGGAQYGYYANPGEEIPELIIKYMRGDGTTEKELISLAKDRTTLYLLWNQVDDYLAREFNYADLEDLKGKIKEYIQRENLPEDAPYVVVTDKKDLIDGHIAAYHRYCRWVSSLDDLRSSVFYPLEDELEWEASKEFLEEEEKRLTTALSKTRLELSRVKNMLFACN